MYYNDPTNNPYDRIRLIIGDWNNDEILLPQPVLEYLYLSCNKNEKRAAIKALEYLFMDMAKYTDEVVGDVQIKLSQRFNQMKIVLGNLKSSTMGGLPYAGGISVSDIESRRNNPDSPVKAIESGWATTYPNLGCRE